MAISRRARVGASLPANPATDTDQKRQQSYTVKVQTSIWAYSIRSWGQVSDLDAVDRRPQFVIFPVDVRINPKEEMSSAFQSYPRRVVTNVDSVEPSSDSGKGKEWCPAKNDSPRRGRQKLWISDVQKPTRRSKAVYRVGLRGLTMVTLKFGEEIG
ncbi:hypothetical protein SCHPADRAFT_930514 [Schizopora paradoxa]|uniref:Uncharacterized protein n=1 Tax=Schizopora paradoxa TaxID=27342 RepID=A0A0H2RLZ9_9AGAM|nr:hypothetical protein SCHPADRAFT_930514 [Schizopora paradoxa]